MSFWIPLSVAAVFALLLAERLESRPGIAIAKLAAAACFLGYALSEGALESDYGRLLFLGLAFCALGDALLLPLGQSLWFKLGIGAFLLGHLAYAIAFIRVGFSPLAFGASTAILVFIVWRVSAWLRPHVPKEFEIAVRGYLVVISAMVACAFASVAVTRLWPIGIGSALFAASDLSVARERFIRGEFINSAWGLPAYFGSQMILASTAGLTLP